ncbi:MAG: NADH-quinone oxidoreductase subunit N [Deltaproteobacteria bacterium]|nr:NADH-quinone oxidoreductase subunit N [Deltaproteobacteria bacterium]
MPFAQEIYLCLTSLVLFGLCLANPRAGTARATALALSAGAVAMALWAFGFRADLFSGTYRVDAFSQSFKVLVALGFFLAVAFGEGLRGVDQEHEADYFLFLSLSMLGLTLLTSSVELLTLYISLELSSYSLYVLVPLRRGGQGRQAEAGVKYVLFGAVASGISLFGMSYVFGLAKTTQLDDLVRLFPQIATTPVGILALTMMLGGFFFKLALFPFHFWTPDIYQGTANETAGVIATLPKIGAVAVLIRLTGLAGHTGGTFTAVLMVLAALSMTYGNLSALVQTDLKRLLAFSSIAHAGFMMMGILSGSIQGYAGAMYYVGGYLLMNLALFFVIYSLAPGGENVTLEHLRGLHRRAPLLAFTLATAAFGLAGIPPTAGFSGKFFVLTAALQQGHLALVIIAALNTAIGIFYYLKMVRAAYSSEGEEVEAPAVALPLLARALGYGFTLAILLIGAFPGAILDLFRAALGGMV